MASHSSRRIAYVRNSPGDPPDALVQLAWSEVDMTFTDSAGPDSNRRPARRDALEALRPGDTLVVHSMDRIAKNLDELFELLYGLTAVEVSIEFVREAVTVAPLDPLQLDRDFALLKADVEFTAAGQAERQRFGIAKSTRIRRNYTGRNLKLTHRQMEALLDRYANTDDSVTQIAREAGISRDTLYRYVKAGSALLLSTKLAKRRKDTKRATRTRNYGIDIRRRALSATKGTPLAKALEDQARVQELAAAKAVERERQGIVCKGPEAGEAGLTTDEAASGNVGSTEKTDE